MNITETIILMIAIIVVLSILAWADREQPPSTPREPDEPQVIEEDEL